MALAPARAHARELPGKRRVAKEVYFALQPISSPGCPLAGMREPLGLISTSILVVLTPLGSADCWLTRVALLGRIGLPAVYGLLTHPVNQVWRQGEHLRGVGAGVFSLASTSRRGHQRETGLVDWTAWRDRWEYSPVGRAGLATVRLMALGIALSG